MDDAKKREIIERLKSAAQTNAQVVTEGVDVVDRYVKTDGFRELVSIADQEELELFISALDGPVILRLRERVAK